MPGGSWQSQAASASTGITPAAASVMACHPCLLWVQWYGRAVLEGDHLPKGSP